MSITEADDEQFIKMVDEMVMSAENDSELAEGLKWIDMQARKQGLTFYEMALIILKKHVAEKRAREWLKARTA
jgi:hypothetical protein